MPAEAIVGGDSAVRRLSAAEAATYSGPGFVWSHIEAADEASLAWLKQANDIPDVAAAALVATETRPRCDMIEQGALINLRGPAEVEPADSDRLVSIRIWVREGRVCSVSRRPLVATQQVVAATDAGSLNDPGDLVAEYARAISTELDPQVADLGDRLDDTETDDDPRQAYRLRREIANIRSEAIAFRRFVAPNRDALLTLAGLPVTWLAQEDRLHIKEAADRFARMTEELEAVRERAALVHEQLTDLRAEQIDSRALLLSIVALIFLPLTFISGLLGMNVEGIPYAKEPWAFWGVIGVCAAIALAITILFSAIHWWRR
jgi:zinc transporter